VRAGSPDIIEDQCKSAAGSLFADIVLDRLEYLFGALNAGAGGGTDMQLNEARIDARKKSVPTKRNKMLPPITTKPATAGSKSAAAKCLQAASHRNCGNDRTVH